MAYLVSRRFRRIERYELVYGAIELVIVLAVSVIVYGVIDGIAVWLGLDMEEDNSPSCYCQALLPEFEPNYAGVPKQESGCLYLDHEILMWYFMSEDI